MHPLLIRAIGDRRIGPSAFRLLAAVLLAPKGAGGWADLSDQRLSDAAALGGRKPVSRVMPQLIDAGYLEKLSGRGVRTGHKCNRYRIVSSSEIQAA